MTEAMLASLVAGARVRLDQALVERGLAPSRERARALILAGQVTVDGRVESKAGTAVAADAAVELVRPDHPYVGRGGVKLAHALDAFGIAVEGREALDIGASTGGFTDVLLQRGAARVVALDVGHGQLDWRIRNDPRVVVIEGGTRAFCRRTTFPVRWTWSSSTCRSSRWRRSCRACRRSLGPGADVVALVKPQFEAGRDEVGKGASCATPTCTQRVVERVTAEAAAVGLVRQAMTPSPITGAEGNVEELVHLRRA